MEITGITGITKRKVSDNRQKNNRNKKKTGTKKTRKKEILKHLQISI
jgi:hypothetical protein